MGTATSETSTKAFRWTAQTGMVPALAGIRAFQTVWPTMHLGRQAPSVVSTPDAFFEEAAGERWTEQDGMVSLGDFPGGRFERAARAGGHGSVVVGFGHDGNPVGQFGDLSVFIWDAVHGMRALRERAARAGEST